MKLFDRQERGSKKLKLLGKATKETKGYFGFMRENWAGGWRWGNEW